MGDCLVVGWSGSKRGFAEGSACGGAVGEVVDQLFVLPDVL